MSYYTSIVQSKLIDILNATIEIKESVLSPIELIEHLNLIIQLTDESLSRLREEDASK